MNRVQTQFGGITTTSSHTDGDFISLVNLRNKNGVLQPVTPRKVVNNLSREYDIVFIHRNNEYKNLIGVVNDSNSSSVYCGVMGTSLSLIQSGIEGTVVGIEQIGNTLSLITKDSVYYMIYRNGVYRFIGKFPELPAIIFKTTDEMKHLTYLFSSEYQPGSINADNLVESIKGLTNKAMEVLVNGGEDENGNRIVGQGEQLFDAHFIRYAFRLYDGSLTMHSPPILVMPVKRILNIKTVEYRFMSGVLQSGYLVSSSMKYSGVDVYGYRIGMRYDFSGFDDWIDLIKSVDIFISPALGISSTENIRDDFPTEDSIGNQFYEMNLVKEMTDKMLENVKNAGVFYFIRSIDLGNRTDAAESAGGDVIYFWDEIFSKDSDVENMKNLSSQERMTDDAFSHHKQGASVSYVYNSRLHLCDIKTEFFRGFDIDFFQWGNTGNEKYNGFGDLIVDFRKLVFEVEIEVGNSIEMVYTQEIALDDPFLASGFFSYPDTRAKRLNIYILDPANEDGPGGKLIRLVFTASLTAHKFLNLAYHVNYINGVLQPIYPNIIVGPSKTADFSTKVFLAEPNKIKVSGLNNPFVFPAINTYTVGDGEILAVSTNSMNVSDFNYGQFPLYVFTTRGIWTLNVGTGEAVYSTLHAPVSAETPVSRIICSTPYGVVFVGKKGMMIINGNTTEFISPQLKDLRETLDIESPTSLIENVSVNHAEGVILNYAQQSFGVYLENIDNIMYDPHESELIISNKESEFNYVLNLQSNSFYQSTEAIKDVVKNAFPDLFVIEGTKLKDYAAAETDAAHVSFITRPLSFGMEDIKKLDRMILRGILRNINNPVSGKKTLIVINHSNDGVNFPTTRGKLLEPANYKDIDMGLLSRTKYRKFLLSFGAKLSKESKIAFLESIVDKEYDNEKMR